MAMEPLKSNVQEIIRAFLNDGGKHILTQGTDIADFNENFEVAKIANMIKDNCMQVALVYIQYILKRLLYKEVLLKIYLKNHRKR